MMLTSGAALCLALLLLVGCASKPFKAGKGWDPDEAAFFDDGVDLVEDLSSLSGRYAYAQERAYEGRIYLSDLIAIVDIYSIQTQADFEGVAAKRILVRVEEALYGSAPDTEIQLASAAEAPGHELILRNENRLKGRFLLFARWFEQENNAIGHHFHLSPASEALINESKRRLQERRREEAEAAVKKK
ncbi:MAG: hypothetical protein QNJ97_08280 [Myxococcota bacterium]|nr:hypothetical protein [Myxococcota bacterium]